MLSLASVLLPDTGVEMPGLINAAVVYLGTIVVVAVGGYFAFLAIRAGLRWALYAVELAESERQAQEDTEAEWDDYFEEQDRLRQERIDRGDPV